MQKGNISQTNQTLVDQLRYQNALFIAEYGVKSLIQMKPNCLRLHTRNNRKIINIDITYNEGLDLYEIKAYLVKALEGKCDEIASYEQVYFDQLHDLIKKILW